MPTAVFKLDTPALRTLLGAGLFILLAVHFYFAKWGLANMASVRAERAELAALTAEMAPADPQTHYAAAVLYDKTFLPEDQAKSLAEFERAAALSPHNYLLWLALGNARSRAGDLDGAEAALERARELAPNYASVRWAFGNLLVRRGRIDEGIDEIRRAVMSDRALASPAVTLAIQLFPGDTARLRHVAEGSPDLKAALAIAFARQKQFDEAATVWSELAPADMAAIADEQVTQLVQLMLGGHQYRHALAILKSRGLATTALPGRVTNGGFEEPISLRASTPFEWQIGTDGGPQAVPVTGTRRGGERSLALVFNLTETKDFRPVSQTIALEPQTAYRFEAFYRSELKDSRQVKWEIVDAAGGKLLAATAPTLNDRGDWERLSAEFTVPAGSDAVIIRLAPEGCSSSPVCRIVGKIWFDDIGLARK